jgi:hypothetical protein
VIELAFARVDCRQKAPEQHRTSNRRGARFRWVWPNTYTAFLWHINNAQIFIRASDTLRNFRLVRISWFPRVESSPSGQQTFLALVRLARLA